jgi:hypothetical protein
MPGLVSISDISPMKKLLSLIILTASFTLAQAAAPVATPAAPAAEAPAATGQQNRMKTCNADPKAQTLKGDERKAFMKSCLRGEATVATGTPQQNKMKTCNLDASAKALKGDARKAFMSTCLKG